MPDAGPLGLGRHSIHSHRLSTRVTLKAGEVRTLRFTVKSDDLKYWSAVTNDRAQDEGEFNIRVGGNSEAGLASSFEVKQP